MAQDLLRRIVHSLLVVVGVLVLVFVVAEQIGDPARLMLPADAPIQLYLDLRQRLGLDDPFLERFWRTVSGWLTGDFGDSLWQGVPALGLALQRVPATLTLTLVSLSIAVPLALALGTRSAIKPGSWTDRALTTVSLAGVSIADFWLG